MPLTPDYHSATDAPPSRPVIVVRFVSGMLSYGAILLIISTLHSLAGAKMLGRLRDPFLWAIGIGFLWLTVRLYRTRSWRPFSIGVISGVAASIIGVLIFFLAFSHGMKGFGAGG